MRLPVSKIKNNKFILLLLCGIGFMFCQNSAFSETVTPSLWDQWIDNAYKLTWHSSTDIDNWVKENETKIFKESLLSYVEKREKYALPDQKTDQKSVQHVSFPDSFYRRVAIAEMLLYLQTKDVAKLKKAVKIIMHKSLQSKIELPEFAFWFHYIQAHLKMENGDSIGFINHVYRMWFDSILKLESTLYDCGASGLATQLPGFYQSLPFLYLNIANLIVPRAILEKRLTNLDTLGNIIWNLSNRMPQDQGYGLWVKQISDRILGTKSDIFRLTYTVLLMDAENQKRITIDLIDSSDDVKKIEANIIKAYKNYDYLNKIAHNQMGKVVVLTQHLNLTSFILSRLYETGEKRQRLETIGFLQRKGNQAWHEPLNILSRAITGYDNLAQIATRTGGWRAQGFLDWNAYTTVMRELWQSIMNLCLDNGFYYRESIDPNSGENFLASVPLLENSIHQYLDFFEKYVSLGNLDIVPNNAYYGAVEASQLLSELYFMSGSWEKGVGRYEKGFYYWLQGAEIFPFDVNSYYSITNQLSLIGRLDLYKKSLILLTKKIKNSHVINKFKAQKSTKYLGKPLGQLQENIPQVIFLAPSSVVLKNGIKKVPEAIIQRVEIAQSEIEAKKDGFKKDPNDKQKIADSIKFLGTMKAKEKFEKGDIEKIEKILSQTIKVLRKYEKDKSDSKNASETINFSPRNILPDQLKTKLQELDQIRDEISILKNLPDYKGVRDALVLEIDHPYHKLIREFYHENSRRDLFHLRLLKNKKPLFSQKESSQTNDIEKKPNLKVLDLEPIKNSGTEKKLTK